MPRVSKDENGKTVAASWFETAQERLLTMRGKELGRKHADQLR